jgi:streptogramin lyase
MGIEATFNNPSGVAVDGNGNVYVADSYNNKIRKITASGEVTTLAGSGAPGTANGTGTAARFNGPSGVTVDQNGILYVADTDNQKIRKIEAGGVVSTLAGSGSFGSTDGTETLASFNGPSGVAVDVNNNVFVADAGNNKIRKISATGEVTTLAGSGVEGAMDGSGIEANFKYPEGVAVDGNGKVYVADGYNNKIRKISPE